MLGDEDRAILYADFLAGFQLNRFVEKAGSTMTGNLSVPLLYSSGGAAVQGTSTQMIFGSTDRQTVIRSSALNNVQISNGSVSGVVYHTANKPTPNELGMRTNAENDSRFAIKGSPNTFNGNQTFIGNDSGLILQPSSVNAPHFVRGRNPAGDYTWYVGKGTDSNSKTVSLHNYLNGTSLTLEDTLVGVNKNLRITGQVQPSDFSNLDARFFTQTVANGRFAQIAGNNNFTGNITFTKGSGLEPLFVGTGKAITLKSSSSTDKTLYIEAVDSSNVRKWFIGNGGNNDDFVISVLGAENNLVMSTQDSTFKKSLYVTGQVIPTNYSNFDSRYVPSSLTGNLARRDTGNTFVGRQTIKQDHDVITLQTTAPSKSLYIHALDFDGSRLWYVGKGDTGNVLSLQNLKTGSTINLNDDAYINKNLRITGQVQPSDWANIDSRYIAKSVESNLAKLNVFNNFTTDQKITINTTAGLGLTLENTHATTNSIYLQGKSKGQLKWELGSDNTGNINFNNNVTGAYIRMGADGTVSSNRSIQTLGQVQPSDWGNIDSRYLPSGELLNRALLTKSFNGSSNNYPLGYSGFVRNNFNSARPYMKALAIHVSHPDFTDGGHSRGISFEYGSFPSGGLNLYTYGFKADGSLTGIAKIYTEADKPTPSEIGTYTSAQIDQKFAQSAADSTDLKKVYPVGIVVWFNSNQNPNTVMADTGMTWTYLSGAVGRTIRVGTASGSDVTQTGGSDSVALAAGNIPSHTHSFSATTGAFDHGTKTTSSFDYGSKTTSSNGAHTHTRGTMNITGTLGYFRDEPQGKYWTASGAFAVGTRKSEGSYSGVNNNWGVPLNLDASKTWTGNTSSDGAHTHSVAIGAHSHTVAIGSHTHSVSGTTGATGSGQSFSVANTFYRLMAWVRTA